jgi:hypothetical protein
MVERSRSRRWVLWLSLWWYGWGKEMAELETFIPGSWEEMISAQMG